MNHLPTPILGEITALTINTPDLEISLNFYKKLGFKELFRAEWPFPWIQITDGVLLIMLRKESKPVMNLTYYVKDIKKVTTDLEKKGIQFELTPAKSDPVKRYLLRSPDGLGISLVSIIQGFTQPPGPGMLQMKPEDYANPAKYVNKVCGMFGELAHPVAHLAKSIKFWKQLGFKAVSEFTAPYPWAIVTDGLSIVGLHQTDRFTHPAITYFAADMRQKIASLKKAGLELADNGPEGAEIETPESQHIFLYHLGGVEKPGAEKEIVTEVLETDRLQLRALTPVVYAELFNHCSDEMIIRYLGLKGVAELNTERSNWGQGMTTYRISFKRFLLIEKVTGDIIGSCGYHNWYALHRRAELGYALNQDSKKGMGFMKEALAAVIRYGFRDMDLNRIEAFTGTGNVASQRLLKGFGFTEEGRLRAHFSHNGVLEDSVCFGLLRDEYAG